MGPKLPTMTTTTPTPNTSEEFLAATANLAAGATTIATKTHPIATRHGHSPQRRERPRDRDPRERDLYYHSSGGTRESPMTITAIAGVTTAMIANAPVTKALTNLPPPLFRPGPFASKSKRMTKTWRNC